MKGFTKGKGKSKKFIPTSRKKVSIKKDDIKYDSKNPIKNMHTTFKKHLDKKKKKKSLEDIIDDEVEKRVDALHDDTDAYDDYLDEVLTPEQLIEDYSYSRILKESDDVAYRTGRADWADQEIREMENEIRSEAEDSAKEELDGHEDDDDYDSKLDSLIEEKVDEITQDREDNLDDDQYDEYLDSSGGNPDYVGSPSRVLKEIDDVAYRTGRNDWADGERDRIKDEVTDEIDEDASIESGEFEEQ